MQNSNSNFSSSISCTDGFDFTISPSSSIALNTRNALAAFKIHDSSIFTSTLYTWNFFASASLIAFTSNSSNFMSIGAEFCAAFASSATAGAGAGFSSGFPSGFPSDSRNAFRRAIIGSLSSVPSSAVCWILSRYACNASRQSNKISTRSEVTFILPFLISEKTFSIICVRCCILLYPIVPAIPFKECAARKISLIVSAFSGSSSSIIRCWLKSCKCSCVSSINISKY